MLPELLLAVEVDGDGAHPAAWRHSGRAPGAVLGSRALLEVAATADRSGFALASFADSPLPPGSGPDAAGRLEAGTRAAYVATRTTRTGLAPELHVTTTEPFHLATQLASLDHASNGRAAWVIGAASSPEALATIGAAPLPAGAARQEVIDVIDIARDLWDSWEDDAVIKDVPTGRYLDSGKVHHIDFEGAAFSVKGPLITPRPPQGQVVVLAPDSLDVDDRADIVLVGRADVTAIGSRAAAARRAGAPLVFAEVEVVLDGSERRTDNAASRLRELDGATPWPESGRLRHVGSAAALTELLASLAAVVDGVRLHPAVLAVDLPAIAGEVLPALAAVGRLRAPQPGDSLRASLGLPRPLNRFATTTATTA